MNELINNKLSIPTIALIIFNKENNKFLLLKNKRGKYGFLTEKHKEKGNYQNDILLSKEESLKQTAQRGAKEELDLDIYFHELEEVDNFETESLIKDQEGILFTTTVFILKYDSRLHPNIKINEPDKCIALEWFTFKEIEKLSNTESLRILSKEILRRKIIYHISIGWNKFII